jgi:hypothetical protein
VGTETFNFGTPATLDANDGTTLYVLGDHWTASADGSFTGVEWYVPATLSGDNHYILAYQDGDGDSPRKTKPVSPVAGGGLQRFLFTTPLATTSGTGYFACVLTNHYVFTPSESFPQTNSGHLTTSGFSIVPTGPDNAKIPTTPSSLNFHISPVVVFANENHNVTVSAALSLVAATAKSKGARAAVDVALGLAPGESGHKLNASVSAAGLLSFALSVMTTNPEAAARTGSWYGLLSILEEAAAEQVWQQQRTPMACPNDGEPLRTGPDGALYCPYDGWRWDG